MYVQYSYSSMVSFLDNAVDSQIKAQRAVVFTLAKMLLITSTAIFISLQLISFIDIVFLNYSISLAVSQIIFGYTPVSLQSITPRGLFFSLILLLILGPNIRYFAANYTIPGKTVKPVYEFLIKNKQYLIQDISQISESVDKEIKFRTVQEKTSNKLFVLFAIVFFYIVIELVFDPLSVLAFISSPVDFVILSLIPIFAMTQFICSKVVTLLVKPSLAHTLIVRENGNKVAFVGENWALMMPSERITKFVVATISYSTPSRLYAGITYAYFIEMNGILYELLFSDAFPMIDFKSVDVLFKNTVVYRITYLHKTYEVEVSKLEEL